MVDQEIVPLTVGLIAIMTAFIAWLKWVSPLIRKGKKEAIAVRDVLLGRDAITDTTTGREVSPPLPGIGQRIDTVERAVTVMADQSRILDNHTDLIAANAEAIEDLKAARMERVITRAESAQAWAAMEAVAKQDHPEEEQ